MPRPILCLVRGKTLWMLSHRGIPEDKDLTPGLGASAPCSKGRVARQRVNPSCHKDVALVDFRLAVKDR